MRILEDAIVRMLRDFPFYGHFLLGCRKEPDPGPYPLGITLRNGVPVLSCNEAALATLEPEERQALLEHLLKHLIHLHMARRKGRTERTWDVACDCAVNPSIANLPPSALLPERFGLESGLAAEEYYEELARRFDTGNLEGGGIGDAHQDHRGAEGEGSDIAEAAALADDDTSDSHRAWRDADTTPLPLAEEVVRRMAVDAWRSSGGDVPEDIRPVIDRLLSPSPIPWRQVLRQFVAAAGRVGRTTTWMRVHRRFGHDTPGIRKRQRLNLLVGIDVSESTDRPELREAFARELLAIARGREARITVLYANTRIRRIEQFTGIPQVVESFHGGGFTDLRPVFDHARSMKPPPAAVIYLTDGFGPAPERMEFPTLWVLTKEGRPAAPWGAELQLDT
jgi:predicted metal-dependent peptidase